MTYKELLTARRSIRKYQDKSVPMETIKELITESTLAPNAGNEQPWKFIVVQDKALMLRMSDDSKKNILERIRANPDNYAKKYDTMLSNPAYNVYYNAPCLVLVLGLSHLKNVQIDCTLAASYFMMGAADRGLGTCWVNLGGVIKDPDLVKILGIPEDCQIVAPIIIGYPDQNVHVPKRKDPEILTILNG